MSKTFAFSANAEPFVPTTSVSEPEQSIPRHKTLEGIREHRDRLLRYTRHLQEKNEELEHRLNMQASSEKKMKNLEKENERLNKEIRETTKKLLFERGNAREKEILLDEKSREINTLENNISSLNCINSELECANSNLESKYEEIDMINVNLRNEQINLLDKRDEWIGRCLRLDFIFKKIKQINALPEDHGAWVWDMVEDIEFPNGNVSVFLNVPQSVRRQYLPSENDANIQFQEDENSIIEGLSQEAELFNQNLSEHFRRNLDENPEDVLNHIRIIQARFRQYIRPNLEKHIKAAIKIQSIWRGFISRGIITYKGTLEINDSLTLYKLIPDKKVKSTHSIVPAHLRDRPFRMNFANTGKEVINYQWLKIQPHTLEGTVADLVKLRAAEFSLKPGEVISIKVYFGHWFKFMSVSDKQEQFFRIMPEGFLGRNMRSGSTTVFDLNTKLTVTKDHYYEWSRGLYGTHAVRVPANNSNNITEDDRFNRILNTDHLNLPDNISDVQDNSDDDSEDNSDDARLMLAIQLSLEQTSSLTSDVSDLEIHNLFQ